MAEGKKSGHKKLVSRRDFLVAGGAVIAAGALSACTPTTLTSTVTTTVPTTVKSTVTTTVPTTVTGAAVTVTSTVPGAATTVTKTVPTTVTGAVTTVTATATTTATPTTAKLTVFDPRGTPSPITLLSMAKRLDTLDGKTIYVVDIMYPYTQVFCQEVAKILQEKYPKTTWIYRQKYGTYSDDDPDTWDLIQAKGKGMVVLVGH
jgi:hypothetical protein